MGLLYLVLEEQIGQTYLPSVVEPSSVASMPALFELRLLPVQHPRPVRTIRVGWNITQLEPCSVGTLPELETLPTASKPGIVRI